MHQSLSKSNLIDMGMIKTHKLPQHHREFPVLREVEVRVNVLLTRSRRTETKTMKVRQLPVALVA